MNPHECTLLCADKWCTLGCTTALKTQDVSTKVKTQTVSNDIEPVLNMEKCGVKRKRRNKLNFGEKYYANLDKKKV